MFSKFVGSHLRANLVGYLALFFALGLGTAWAVERNGIRSKHIADGQVKAKDVNLRQVQARVGSDCAPGQAIRTIAADGTVSCEGQGGPPSGPASGDLRGNYPAPAIADGSVNSAKTANGSLTGEDIGDDSLDGFDIQGLSFADMQAETLTGDQIANNTVGADEIVSVATRLGAINIASGNEDTVTASCLAGEQLLGGGGGPADNPPGSNQIILTDSQRVGFGDTWTVTAYNASSSTATVVAEAHCLAA